jgi:hypothetical protein
LEADQSKKLEKLREQMELEFQEKSEELDKKHGYKLEQLRQELADKHEQVSEYIVLGFIG